MISYAIFDCSGQNESERYKIGYDPCDLRSGCLDGGEFYSDEADSWRIDRNVYRSYDDYIKPIEFLFDVEN